MDLTGAPCDGPHGRAMRWTSRARHIFFIFLNLFLVRIEKVKIPGPSSKFSIWYFFYNWHTVSLIFQFANLQPFIVLKSCFMYNFCTDEMIFLYSSTTCVDWTAIIAIAVVAVVRCIILKSSKSNQLVTLWSLNLPTLCRGSVIRFYFVQLVKIVFSNTVHCASV